MTPNHSATTHSGIKASGHKPKILLPLLLLGYSLLIGAPSPASASTDETFGKPSTTSEISATRVHNNGHAVTEPKVAMRIVGSCETDASGNLKFTIHQSKVTKKQAKVKVTKPKDKSIGEKIRYKQQKLHENDHANRFRGDYPLLAFLNKKDPKNYHMFELLEGAAVFASTDQFFEKNYKNESKRKKIQDAIGIYSNEELTHKREGESNLYDFHGVTRDVTYWDAYLLYKKEGEEGFIKAYKEFEERFLSTGIQEIVTDLLNKGGTKIEQGQVCNFTLEIKNTEQGTSYLLDPHIILDKNVKRYCGSCYVGDTMRSMCTNPACSNFGRKPSEAKPEKGAQRL